MLPELSVVMMRTGNRFSLIWRRSVMPVEAFTIITA
jgi:hypothetical protein